LISISASGNSKNLICAIEQAKKMNIETVSLTSFDGGIIKKMVDLSIHLPTLRGEYGPAEDCHMILDHLIGAYLNRRINGLKD
jgi:D-sedoheptulose 7-phosphate isomerase